MILIIPLKLAYELKYPNEYPNEKETATWTAGIRTKTFIL